MSASAIKGFTLSYTNDSPSGVFTLGFDGVIKRAQLTGNVKLKIADVIDTKSDGQVFSAFDTFEWVGTGKWSAVIEGIKLGDGPT